MLHALHRDIMASGNFPDIVPVIAHTDHLHLFLGDHPGQLMKQQLGFQFCHHIMTVRYTVLQRQSTGIESGVDTDNICISLHLNLSSIVIR